ncbi:hypothetical protein [Agarivorans sp. 1_MG-2023]|uniref:hypothetical protein n=1 Tax=Agarivorans sp. 1_MG-2023 TaxID=3062634 RepID=UPI0026E4597F|nr:hypothetical protein [Agarivorans sp. 1_MG-2023]MDO6765345.1 hypothetical protein [Agarivorans sp. 1_MG-2023]
MRKFQNLSQQEQAPLVELYPELEKVFSVEDTDKYRFMAISVFDHWLSEVEANKLLADVPEIEQRQRDKKFDSFSRVIAENTEVISFTFKGRRSKSRPVFRKFTSENSKAKYMESASNYVSNKYFFSVALPKLEALYFEGSDDTNVFYLRNERFVYLIETWANACGLYCLD